jgi:hypothetical protein
MPTSAGHDIGADELEAFDGTASVDVKPVLAGGR